MSEISADICLFDIDVFHESEVPKLFRTKEPLDEEKKIHAGAS